MDLDLLTVPSDEREIFGPVHAWPGVPDRIYVAVHRSGPLGVFQYAYDPVTGLGYSRSLPEPGAQWSPWAGAGTPPPALTIVSLNPASMEIGGPDTVLQVIGEGFTSASVINFNGGDEQTTFVDATRVTTLVKPSLAGMEITLPIYVRNYQRASNTVYFSFTAAEEE